MLTDLATRIVARDAFRADYMSLMRAHIARQVVPDQQPDGPAEAALVRLLQAGLSLAGSEIAEHRQCAYRIGTALLDSHLADLANLRDAVGLLLARLGNFPAEAFVGCQDGRAYAEVPLPLSGERELHMASNSVQLLHQQSLILTDFQRAAWAAAQEESAISVAAPTSAGKSFAMQHLLCARAVREPGLHQLYLVPTRALIGQVSVSLTSILDEYGHMADGIAVSAIPLPPDAIEATTILYVLTQERLQVLMESMVPRDFGLVVVDEAHLVSEGARGTILQTVLELIDAGRSNRTVFGCPSASDVGVFQEILSLDRLLSLRTEDAAVAQNIVLLDLATDRVTVRCSALIDGEALDLGVRTSPFELTSDRQLLAVLSFVFGKDSSTLVYGGGQAECEKIALIISDCARTVAVAEQAANPEVDDFLGILRTHIHPEYPLIAAIESGVGFHYANMPAIVRLGVEALFTSGDISFLVCTSTLLHGVNFPAKNLFMHKPTRGRGTPLSPEGFWNLAGRAGRLGRELEGNVFLINRASWEADPVREEAVTRADWPFVSALREHAEELLEIVAGEPVRNNDAEATAARLYFDRDSGRFDQLSDRIAAETSSEYLRDLDAALARTEASVTLPNDLLLRHTAIYPGRQQAMYDYVLGKIDDGDVDGVIPLHPSQGDAYTSLLRLFKRFHNVFEMRPRGDRSHTYYAVIALRWMRGAPIAQLISERLRRQRTSAPTAIRAVLKEVETDLRFRYVKFSRCYNDILAHALRERDAEGRLGSIPAIPLYLELGACSGTMVSLIGLGLSRTTSALLAETAANQSMDRAAAASWLSRSGAAVSRLPLICQREVAAVVG